MPETPESDEVRRLVERLANEGRKTLEFFGALSPEHWRMQVYTDGPQWTARQVLAHFVSAEEAFNLLLANVLEGGSGAPEGFDIDEFNESEVASLEAASASDLLGQFIALRQANTQLVAGMYPEDLQKAGRHPFLGMTTLEDMIKLLYRHNQIHQRDVRKLLSPA